MKDVKWRVISPAKHFDPKVVAEVLSGQVDMLVAGRQYTIDGSVVEIGSIGSLSQMGIQLISNVDKPTVKTMPQPMFQVGDSVRVTNSSLPLHLHVGHLIAEDVGGRFLFECAGTKRKGWVSQEDVQGVPKGWVPQEPPQPSPSANVPENPGSQPWTPKVREAVMSLQTSQMGTVIDIDSNNLEFPYKVDYGYVIMNEALSDLASTIAGAIQQANAPESPDSSVDDHVPDVTKMVEPKIVARYDTEGRDVTELPGLWSEDDIQYREFTADDLKNLPIKCEVRGSRGQEWHKAKLIKICESPRHPYIAEIGEGKLVQAAHCRIKVAPVVKLSLTPDTPDRWDRSVPNQITIGYTVSNAYEQGAEPITEPIQRKRVLYIAGPMRGIAFFNYPMFDRVAKNLREAGNEVISPADEDRKQDGFDPFANPEYRIPDACVFPKEMDFHKTVRRCLDAVLRCDEIVLLPGWEKSNGAVAELTLAMWLGKRVRHLRISEGGYFSWSCYWMGLEALACLLRDHHIPQVAAPAPVVVDEDDDDEDILDTAARITRGDRNASYGPPDQDFRRTAGMWSALFQAKLQDGVTFEPRDVAMAMILLKCSRESHQRKLDNWVDIAGYARCGSMCN
jgi:hypothetical protein